MSVTTCTDLLICALCSKFSWNIFPGPSNGVRPEFTDNSLLSVSVVTVVVFVVLTVWLAVVTALTEAAVVVVGAVAQVAIWVVVVVVMEVVLVLVVVAVWATSSVSSVEHHGTAVISWYPVLRPSQEDRPIQARPYSELRSRKVVWLGVISVFTSHSKNALASADTRPAPWLCPAYIPSSIPALPNPP